MITQKVLFCAATAVIAAACFGCSESVAGQKAGQEEWVRHQNPLGFVVSHPPKWTVETGEEARILLLSPDKSVFALIQPFLQRKPVPARAWTEQALKRFDTLFPGCQIGKTEQRTQTPDEVLTVVTYGRRGRASVLCSIHDQSGMLYAIGAPEDRFEAEKKALIRILESFKFSTAARPAPDADIKYVRWVDPGENAFYLDVPDGWRITGGLRRFGPIDVRADFTATSPDGKIIIRGPDSSLMTFTEPNAILNAAGYVEGSTYNPGGYVTTIRRYTPAVRFLKDYASGRLGQHYRDLRISKEKERPEVAQTLLAIYRPIYRGLGELSITTGEVEFTCTINGQPMQGYHFASNGLYRGGNVGLWAVNLLYGYVAPEDKRPLADAVLGRIVASARPNPKWLEGQSEINRKGAEINSKAQAEITGIISSAYWERARRQDEMSRKWSNTMLGVTDVYDRDTRESWRVAAGHNYYWRKGDTIVGTDTYTRPEIDFTPLREQ